MKIRKNNSKATYTIYEEVKKENKMPKEKKINNEKQIKQKQPKHKLKEKK